MDKPQSQTSTRVPRARVEGRNPNTSEHFVMAQSQVMFYVPLGMRALVCGWLGCSTDGVKAS